MKERVSLLLFWWLSAAATLQMLLLATSVQELASSIDSSLTVGVWTQDLQGQIFHVFGWAVVALVAVSLLLAVLAGFQRAIVGIGLAVFLIGALFGNLLPSGQYELWPYGLLLALGCLGFSLWRESSPERRRRLASAHR